MFQPDEPNGIRNLAVAWLIVFLWSLLIFECVANAADKKQYRLLDVEKMEFRAAHMDPQSRDPYVPQYTDRWRERASLQWRVSVLESLYWDNDVHTETIDVGVVKTVGWHWELGLRINKYIAPFWEHHSRHVMDEKPDERFSGGRHQFPVEDSYGIRFKFVEEKIGSGIWK